MTDEPGLDPHELAQYRDYLCRFALIHVRDRDRVDDVVQETLLAAMESRATFSGKAHVRTWLTGILKHKIMDLFRRQAREAPAQLTADEAEDDFEELFFDPGDRDHWRSFPQAWASPEQAFEQKRFWDVLDGCSKAMPPQIARAFVMREVMGLETDEICKELGITPNNCWVMLYRARMTLRQCLETRWFAQPS
jgi:RNA polymerase sigma-70 factor (ECF subfamily)